MKKNKSLLSFVLILIMLFASTTVFPVYSDDAPTEKSATNIQLQVDNPIMTVDGQDRTIDENGTTPIIQNGRTILPVRAVVEAMGGTVSWNNASQTATLNYGQQEIRLTIGSTTAYLDGGAQTLDVSPSIINGRAMLPIRFISESFGFQVDWEGSTFTITITKETQQSADKQSESKILIAYFTVPESDGVDAVSRASRVVVDGEVVGNTQFIAQTIQNTIGGYLFEIQTVEAYPARPELMERGANEKSQNARPELSTQIDNLEDYDVIFLGYPIWNADLPMPLYSFLEKYDFSGKIVVPFTAHGGSGFSNTIRTIAGLQPDATVITNGFTVSRDNVPNSANDIIDWVRNLNLTN